MAKFPFTDKFGRIFYGNIDSAFERKRSYLLVSDGTYLLCLYDPENEMFTFPSDEDLQISEATPSNFKTWAYIAENDHFIKEQQIYSVYALEKGDLPSPSFKWCKISDIIMNEISFDATKMTGIKNLSVRIKKHG